MSNYSKTTDFAAKDSLPSGDSGKIIRGSEFETEFDNISTAIATKADAASPTFTGTVTIDGLTVDGNTTLGNAATDTVTVTADIASNLIPSADDTYNLGAVGAEWNDLHVDGVAYIDTINGFAATGNVNFGDNNKAQFGAGNDLQIFHSSSSFIRELGSGGLYLDSDGGHVTIRVNSSEKAVEALNNGAVNLYHNNAQKLATTSTGINVTGSVTADALTIDGIATISEGSSGASASGDANTLVVENSGNSGMSILSPNGSNSQLRFGDVADSSSAFLQYNSTNNLMTVGTSRASGELRFTTGNVVERVRIDSSGNVGIGTSSPTQPLHVVSSGFTVGRFSSTGTVSRITFDNSTQTNQSHTSIGADGSDLQFRTNNGERVRIDTAGRVGIGVSAPTEALDVNGRVLISQGGGSGGTPNADAKELVIDGTGTTGISILAVDDPVIRLGNVADGSSSIVRYDTSEDVFQCGSTKPAAEFALLSGNGAEAVRIGSAGNVGIGLTDNTSGNSKLQVLGPGVTVSDSVTALASKNCRYLGVSQADQEATMMYLSATASNNTLIIGGGTSLAEPASVVKVHTGSIGTKSAGVEAMRIDSSGNLLVGKTSTGSTNIGTQLSGDGYAAIVATNANVPLYLQNKAVGGNCRVSFANDSHGVASLGLNDNGDFTIFDSTASTTRFSVTDAKVLTASGGLAGIELGGTTAANRLDDYEEGTFTPEIADANTGGNVGTATSATGVYTKVGNLVTLNIRFTDVVTTGLTGTNTLFIRNLPFTNASLAENQCEGSVRMDLVDVPTGVYSTSFATIANATYGSVRLSIDNGNDVQMKVNAVASGSSDIFITVQHFV